jgi:hypothetical protein
VGGLKDESSIYRVLGGGRADAGVECNIRKFDEEDAKDLRALAYLLSC